MNRHVIAKPVIHLRLPTQEDSFRRQQEVSRLFWDKAAPALEALFDRLAPPGELVRIEQLEVELTFSKWEDFIKAFVEAVTEAVEDEISKLNRTQAPGLQRTAVLEAWYSEWLIFLETGTFRWQVSLPPEAEWNRAVLDTLAISAEAVGRLSQLLRKNPVAFQRLVRQHSQAFLKTLVELCTGERQEKLVALAQELAVLETKWNAAGNLLSQLKPAAAFARQPKLFFWQKVLELVILQREKRTWQTIANVVLPACFEPSLPPGGWQSALRGVADAPEKSFPVLAQVTKVWAKKATSGTPPPPPGEQQNPSPPSKKEDLQVKTPAHKKGEVAKTSGKKPLAQPTNERQAPPEDAKPFATGTQKTGDEPSAKSKKSAIKTKPYQTPPLAQSDSQPQGEQPAKMEGQPLPQAAMPGKNIPASGEATEHFIRNAGVVLLHPFLLPFFRETGLLEGTNFRDENARSKAIHLLQYLATKETGLPEYELLLPKLLCGMPFAMPLEREIELEKPALDEAEHLLAAVIQHWDALGNTSPEGLREGFLKRDGKLEFKNSNWHLKVEHKTLDILFSRLPWGLSAIKLPWMPDLLRVEWG